MKKLLFSLLMMIGIQASLMVKTTNLLSFFHKEALIVLLRKTENSVRLSDGQTSLSPEITTVSLCTSNLKKAQRRYCLAEDSSLL